MENLFKMEENNSLKFKEKEKVMVVS